MLFGQCNKLDLHIFDWVTARFHRITGVITVIVPTGCVCDVISEVLSSLGHIKISFTWRAGAALRSY